MIPLFSTNNTHTLFFLFFFVTLSMDGLIGQEIYIRYNQVGYHPSDEKMFLVMVDQPLEQSFTIKQQGLQSPQALQVQKIHSGMWGQYKNQYILDASGLTQIGDYDIRYKNQKLATVSIKEKPYQLYQNDLLAFMRQQRCGYNPYFDMVCHQRDGKLFYGPVPDSSFFDFTGGWHDAGDQLKYLITSSNATARMLMAYQMSPDSFDDLVDALGHPYPNGIPDVLDEAKWGLDWILKLHPQEDWLIHQIADDRDHRGFKLPNDDNADYGWGPNSYRPAYFANGKPQGLGKWKSASTGISNLAGRCAAALAMGSKIFEDIDAGFALQCRQAAIELYEMGEKNPGFQQGNSYGVPYRYNEDSWHDDMEWGAAELFKLTRKREYLEKSIYHAQKIGPDGWMMRDTMDHYQKYPFMNMGHFSLHSVAPDDFKDTLSHWYRVNIENVLQRASTNAFEIGIPFIWCSNNLLVNFVTQIALYEKMTGDRQFHEAMMLHRDWLFGRNPWGTSMFTGIPQKGETPEDVHIPARVLWLDTPAGGLVDGPVYRSIYDNLLGLTLFDPDEFADFQNDFVTYHDDIGDYSTNEPTMDGTADAILMWVLIDLTDL